MENASATEGIPTDASFEKILGRLSKVVDRLETGDLSLSESLQIFEEGVRLTRLGNERLDRAEQQVEILLANGDTRQLDESIDETGDTE